MRLQRMVCPYLGLSTAVGSFKGADLSVAQSDDLKNKQAAEQGTSTSRTVEYLTSGKIVGAGYYLCVSCQTDGCLRNLRKETVPSGRARAET